VEVEGEDMDAESDSSSGSSASSSSASRSPRDNQSRRAAREISKRRRKKPRALAECPRCHKKYISRTGLATHIQNKICDPERRKNIVRGRPALQQTAARVKSLAKAKLQCENCSRVFTSRYGLSYHVKGNVCNATNEVRKIAKVCGTCGKGFLSEAGYKYHADTCGKRYGGRSDSDSDTDSDSNSDTSSRSGGSSNSAISTGSAADVTSGRQGKDAGRAKKHGADVLLSRRQYDACREDWIADSACKMVRCLRKSYAQDTHTQTQTSSSVNAWGSLIPASSSSSSRAGKSAAADADADAVVATTLHHWIATLTASGLDDAVAVPTLNISVNKVGASGASDKGSTATASGSASASADSAVVLLAPLQGRAIWTDGRLDCFVNAGGPVWSTAFAPLPAPAAAPTLASIEKFGGSSISEVPAVRDAETDGENASGDRHVALLAVGLSRIGFRAPERGAMNAPGMPASDRVGSDLAYLPTERYRHPSLLQVWHLQTGGADRRVVEGEDGGKVCATAATAATASASLSLVYSVGLQRGPIWHVHWAPHVPPLPPLPPPLAGSSAPGAVSHSPLGIVAVVCGDGSCAVLALPVPARIQCRGDKTTPNPTATPTVTAGDSDLIPEEKILLWSYLDAGGWVTCADWCPHTSLRLCLGMADGACGVWDVGTRARAGAGAGAGAGGGGGAKTKTKVADQIHSSSSPPLFWLSWIAASPSPLQATRLRAVQFCPFHPSLLLTAGAENVLRVWDLAEHHRPLYAHRLNANIQTNGISGVHAAQWDPTGAGIYFGGDGCSLMWDPVWARTESNTRLATSGISLGGGGRSYKHVLCDHYQQLACVWAVRAFEFEQQTVVLSAASDGSVLCTMPSWSGRADNAALAGKRSRSKDAAVSYGCGAWLMRLAHVEEAHVEEAADADSGEEAAEAKLEATCTVFVELRSSEVLGASRGRLDEVPSAALAVHCMDTILLPSLPTRSLPPAASAVIPNDFTASADEPAPLLSSSSPPERVAFTSSESSSNTASAAKSKDKVKGEGKVKVPLRLCVYGGAAGLVRLHSIDVAALLHT
jgi:hypothetical protein